MMRIILSGILNVMSYERTNIFFVLLNMFIKLLSFVMFYVVCHDCLFPVATYEYDTSTYIIM